MLDYFEIKYFSYVFDTFFTIKGPLTGAYFVGYWDNGTISSYDSKAATLRYPSGAIFKGIFNSYGPIYGTITYKSGNSFTGDKFKYFHTLVHKDI